MKCYFCQYQLQSRLSTIIKCQNCEKEHGVIVYTSQDDEGLVFAHIYIDQRIFTKVPAVAISNKGSYMLSTGHNYHFRLHLREGFTNLSDDDENGVGDLIKIPHFPVTPANAKQKLQTYLIFL
jgi:hypothetical protein